MSTASRLGYDGEAPLVDYLNAHDRALLDTLNTIHGPFGTRQDYYRPRAGSPRDKGDIGNLPYVVSCKNWGSVRPAEWTRDLKDMCANAGLGTGVVSWKRRGKGNPGDWFVLTTWDLFLPFHDAYLMAELSA